MVARGISVLSAAAAAAARSGSSPPSRAFTTSSSSSSSSLLRELRSWLLYLLPTRYLAVYYPTPPPVAAAMLRLARVGPQDSVLDLGCGDGRILLTAVQQFGARRGLGVELDAQLAAEAAAAVEAAGLGDRITIQQGDARGVDASRASVVTLYLNEAANRALLDSLAPGSLRPGTRVVSLFFPVQGNPWRQWLAQRVVLDRSLGGMPLHLYVVGGAGEEGRLHQDSGGEGQQQEVEGRRAGKVMD